MKTWMIRPETFVLLLANYREQAPLKGTREERDFKPAVRLFNPCGPGTWLLTECDEQGLAFGLCDLAMGCPEIGYVSLDELAELRLPAQLKIEEDLHWEADKCCCPLNA